MISFVEPAAAKSSVPVYQLKVVLAGSRPLIWRRLAVPGNCQLGWLHAALQVAIGWTNSHLHLFRTPEACYTDPRHNEENIFGGESDRNEAKFMLMQVAPGVGAHFEYEYDFGDSWKHTITVEKILPPDSTIAATAHCLGGARACPPEDCGGVWGYANLLKVLKNPKHPEYEDLKAWMGRPIDPESFDLAKVNFWLRKLKWPRVTEAQLRKTLMGRNNYTEE